MCFKFKCYACGRPSYEYCEEYTVTDRTWCHVASETPWGSLKKRCDTCITIQGVTEKLRTLVFREPWLVTDGMAGAPQKAAWEVQEEKEEKEEYESEGSLGDGLTKEERKKVRDEAEAAVMQRWGEMREEQAVVEEEEEEEEEEKEVAQGEGEEKEEAAGGVELLKGGSDSE